MQSYTMKQQKLLYALCIVVLLSAGIATSLSQSRTAHAAAAVSQNYSMQETYDGTIFTFTPTSGSSKYSNAETGLGVSFSNQAIDSGTWQVKSGSQVLGTVEVDTTMGQQSNGNSTAQTTITSNIAALSAVTGTRTYTEKPTPSDLTPGYANIAESSYGDIAVTYNSNTDMRLYTPDPSSPTSNTSKFIRTNATYGTGRAMVSNMGNVIALENSANSSLENLACTYQNKEPQKSTDAGPPSDTANSSENHATMPLSYNTPGSSKLPACVTVNNLMWLTASGMLGTSMGGILDKVCGNTLCGTKSSVTLAIIGGIAAIFFQSILIVSGWSLMGAVINAAAGAAAVSPELRALLQQWADHIVHELFRLLLAYLRAQGMANQMNNQGPNYAAVHGIQPNVIAQNVIDVMPYNNPGDVVINIG